MTKARLAFGFLAVTAVLVLAVTLPSDGTLVQAHGSKSSGRSLVGLWYFDTPVPGPIVSVTGFLNVRRDGTLSWVRSVDAGGPPPPLVPGGVTDMSASSGQGLWRRAGHRRFKGMAFFINYDHANGVPIGMTRVRFTIDLDHKGDSASADFVAAWWFCYGDLPCPPDPTMVSPTFPEPPVALPWTLTRVRMP